MPSRAEWRRWGEWALRLVLVAVLAIALWRSIRAVQRGTVTESVRASAADDALHRATTSERVGAVHVNVDGALSPMQRDWLVALAGAGVRVSWDGEVPAMAVSVDRAREPVAPARLRLVADSGVSIVIVDSVGVIDSVRAVHGVTLEIADAVGHVVARQGSFSASAPVPDRSERRDVLVLGRAGWESRFVLAALGEAGWHARGRLPVAPGVMVTDASLLPLDTSRYDVVIALDSTAADLATAIARFVAQGGGAIVAGSAIELGALRRVVPARAAARRPGRILLAGDTLTRADLPLRPLGVARSDAVALERQPAGLALTIRRAGDGRVAAVGYDESWRWRMEGGAAGAAAHREWWSRLAGLVAPEREVAGTVMSPTNEAGDAAPRAALIAALGPPSRAALSSSSLSSSRFPLLLLVLAALALLAETASRRFRGAS